MFFYADGQEIHKGDIISTGFGAPGSGRAIVRDVFCPGTESSKHFSCMETGGVLIEELGYGGKKVFGLLVEHPEDGRLDEDYELLSRGGTNSTT